MKDNATPLYTSPQLGAKVSTYSEQHSTPLPKYISDYHAHISSTRDDSEYLSSGFQSQFNIFLAKSIGAKRGKSQALPSQIFAKFAKRAVEQSSRLASMPGSLPLSGLMPLVQTAR
jgi:hypothetical protein